MKHNHHDKFMDKFDGLKMNGMVAALAGSPV